MEKENKEDKKEIRLKFSIDYPGAIPRFVKFVKQAINKDKD